MAAPFPSAVNQSTVVDLFSYANTVTENIFGVGAIISLFVIVVMVLVNKGEDVADSFTVAGFFVSIISILFFTLGLITQYVVFGCFSTIMLGVLWGQLSKD